ncbi:methylated-DNA--[protein]-cysteine S-methyltransferase [Paenibacillus thiaminolyticus]|uniref:methylated-DNA--[protein]-cysteine S-methyltransferase n=1 Tax=Paenibacillus thiaminolyticus TaxID=49283 RepID=UPI00233139B3|nr:methylated-DNA--[protein]-cysteine S-methyltransferase [Paenibacillus thiaminolyticus]WCF10827.1 methylated-DNA--[protein]-cysteine S-methyltransferase [Paenibacillus thiaminolyticus]
MEKKADTPIYWSVVAHEEWNLIIAATDAGLCYVGSPGQPLAAIDEWTGRRWPGRTLQRDDGKLQPYAKGLAGYLQGKQRSFAMPLDLQGTPFQLAVWRALCGIPYGQTLSYSELAEQLQRPSAVRAIGTAIGANPVLITVPCHRVIGKDGALTGYRGGLDMKARLLRLEREVLTAEGAQMHA